MKPPKLDMTLGEDPKKKAALIGLLLLAGYFFYANVLSGPDVPPGAQARPAAKAAPLIRRDAEAAALTSAPRESQTRVTAPKEFRPSLKPRKDEQRRPEDIDPTLRLDLIARLASVQAEGAERSLFDFGAVQAKPKPVEEKAEVKKEVAKPKRMIGPELPPPPAPPPVKPPPPPIPLKFYGNALPIRGGPKRVFCMQGEDVLTPGEGDVIQRRYKIIKINLNNVVVEDLDYKNQQTLPIEEPSQSG